MVLQKSHFYKNKNADFFSNYKILKSFKYTRYLCLEIPQVHLAWYNDNTFFKNEKELAAKKNSAKYAQQKFILVCNECSNLLTISKFHFSFSDTFYSESPNIILHSLHKKKALYSISFILSWQLFHYNQYGRLYFELKQNPIIMKGT